MMHTTCINDLVDIWNRVLATHQPSAVDYLTIKLIPHGEGSQRGLQAFEEEHASSEVGHLTNSLKEKSVEEEVAYDKAIIKSSINHNIEFWTGLRAPKGPLLYGTCDCW